MQLERILQSQGFGTRKTCRALIRDAAVMVADQLCEDPYAEFATAELVFTVHGKPWRFRERATLLLNKPAGHECSRAPRHHPSVLSLLPSPLVTRGVQPVGRLDEDTTGLLLLSDDGALIHALTSPRRKVAKVYAVTTKHPVDDAQVLALVNGVLLHDDPVPVAALACEQLGERLLHLTLSEGRYHQVKRMVAAAGNRVEALCRVRLGGLELPPDLPEGAWRWLEATDLERLWAAPMA